MLGTGAGGALHEAAGRGSLRLRRVERDAQRALGVAQRPADDQPTRIVEVGPGLGLEAEDGAVEQDPAQELGLRHHLGQMVDRQQPRVRAGGGLRVGLEVDRDEPLASSAPSRK